MRYRMSGRTLIVIAVAVLIVAAVTYLASSADLPLEPDVIPIRWRMELAV